MATQSEWNRQRAERKAKAIKVVKRNAEQARKALDDYRKAQRQVASSAPAKTVDETQEPQGYEEWTNEALSEELSNRGLPHSGNKAELVARLQESDQAESE